MKHFNTKVGLIIAALTLGVFAVTLAHEKNDIQKGNYMAVPWMMGYGVNYGMGYRGHMMNWWTDQDTRLTLEDAGRLKQIREEFFKKTRELRDKIDRKQLALDQELGKTEPDQEKAFDLQKELSELKSDFDQKALEHQLTLKRTFPNIDFTAGHGKGEK